MAFPVLGNCSGGLNTKAPAHKLAENEVRKAQWADLTYDGGISKLKGLTVWNDDQASAFATPCDTMIFANLHIGSNTATNKYAFFHNNTGMHYGSDWSTGSFQVYNTILYAYLYEPHDFTATVQASGAVGANLVAGTTYEYLISVVDTSGSETPSAIVSAVEGGTAYPIVLSARGCWNPTSSPAVTYKVYKREAAGAWGLLASGVAHARVDMGGGRYETRVTYTDDGNTATTAASIPTANNAKSQVFGLSEPGTFFQLGDYVYFISQRGLLYWDSSSYVGKWQVVKPALYNATYGPNLLADFDSNVHLCSKLRRHHNYFFLCNNDDEPLTLWWSKLGSIDYWPAAAFIEAPETIFGRILDVKPVYDVLSVHLTTGRYTLHGKTFTPDSANFDGYWSRISDVGAGAAESITVVPARGRDLVVSLSPSVERDVTGLLADTTIESYWNAVMLATQIQSKTEAALTCLADMTDWANAFGIYYDDRYILYFPADKALWIGHPDKREDAKFSWFGPCVTAESLNCFAIGFDNELLAGDAARLKIYQLFDGYAASDGTAYTMTVRSRTVADSRGDRAVRRVRARYKKESANSSMDVKAYTDGALTATEAVSCITGDGAEPEVDLSTLRDRGNARYYEISNAVAGESLTVYSITEEADLKRR